MIQVIGFQVIDINKLIVKLLFVAHANCRGGYQPPARNEVKS